jgi:hypothetical protein
VTVPFGCDRTCVTAGLVSTVLRFTLRLDRVSGTIEAGRRDTD